MKPIRMTREFTLPPVQSWLAFDCWRCENQFVASNQNRLCQNAVMSSFQNLRSAAHQDQ